MSEQKDKFRIFSIHSQKGGVGKTSVALAIAGLAAYQGVKSLIIDADMTGASIGDISDLANNRRGQPIHFINDLILAKPSNFELWTSPMPPKMDNERSIFFEEKFCQKAINHGNLYYIPSDIRYREVMHIVPLISQEDHLNFFRHRIEDIIITAFCAGFRAIVIDHSPGLFGFSKATFQMGMDTRPEDKKNDRFERLCKSINHESLSYTAVFLTSPEPHDYRALIPSIYCSFADFFDTDLDDKLIESIESLSPEAFTFIFNKAKQSVDFIKKIGEIFKELKNESKNPLPNDFIKILKNKETTPGVSFAPYIDDFDMNNIITYCQAYLAKREGQKANNELSKSLGDWEKWIDNIANRVSLNL